ncbi:hypothetical protein B0H67DRAFT_304048 [Lasiosphaeris hirsuta]|uniref:DUF6594 domain-containing protein n=1 Tax=Lasiosphaeris hirsuta TaxID=260670 RepID=A0AA40DQN8_9PEZI|nr:hypothetical protein B0H67DRAFT_304048 [Lasiosphaeris hirsuta]
MASSSSTSTSVPSSPLSERSGSSRTSAPLLTGNNRHLARTHSIGEHGDEEIARSAPPIPPWDPTKNEGAPDGWPQLAKFMVERPTVQSFPRFHEANMKNLLYYQVQIAKLERELKDQERDDWEDTEKMEENERYAYYPDKMVRQPSSQQWKLVLELRKCLHQYNRALVELSQVSALPEPSKINVQTLFKWLTDEKKGGCKVAGSGSSAWGDQNIALERQSLSEIFHPLIQSIFVFWKDPPARTDADLVVPRLHHAVDGFTGWVADVWTPFCFGFREYWKKGNKGKDTFETHSESNMLRFTSAVATVVACLLPTLAISILTTARGMTETLLYIGGFTALFSVGLMALATETSRVQIFTATAAYVLPTP